MQAFSTLFVEKLNMYYWLRCFKPHARSTQKFLIPRVFQKETNCYSWGGKIEYYWPKQFKYIYNWTSSTNKCILVPKLATNLISVGQLMEKGNKVTYLIMNVLSRINASRKEKGEARTGFVFEHEKHNRPTGSFCCFLTSSINTNMNKLWHFWHRRLSHHNFERLNTLLQLVF